jgi:hypothetical protein
MAFLIIDERRGFFCAMLCSKAASGAEMASAWQIYRAVDVPSQHDAGSCPFLTRIHDRDGGEKGLGIWVKGIVV